MSIRKISRGVVICALGLSLQAGAVVPRTYYIDALAGKDTNSGLAEQQAWRSLQQVNSHVFTPGDQVR